MKSLPETKPSRADLPPCSRDSQAGKQHGESAVAVDVHHPSELLRAPGQNLLLERSHHVVDGQVQVGGHRIATIEIDLNVLADGADLGRDLHVIGGIFDVTIGGEQIEELAPGRLVSGRIGFGNLTQTAPVLGLARQFGNVGAPFLSRILSEQHRPNLRGFRLHADGEGLRRRGQRTDDDVTWGAAGRLNPFTISILASQGNYVAEHGQRGCEKQTQRDPPTRAAAKSVHALPGLPCLTEAV